MHLVSRVPATARTLEKAGRRIFKSHGLAVGPLDDLNPLNDQPEGTHASALANETMGTGQKNPLISVSSHSFAVKNSVSDSFAWIPRPRSPAPPVLKLRNFSDQITLCGCADNPAAANSLLFPLAYLNPGDLGFWRSRHTCRTQAADSEPAIKSR
jgi:hypothetical protein